MPLTRVRSRAPLATTNSTDSDTIISAIRVTASGSHILRMVMTISAVGKKIFSAAPRNIAQPIGRP